MSDELRKELYLLRNENSNLRDNVGEQAARIADLEDEVSLQKTFNQVADLTAKDDYARISTLEARLSEAVKVLERVKGVVTYPCDRSIQERGYGVRSIDVSGCEYIAEAIDAFIATLGEET